MNIDLVVTVKLLHRVFGFLAGQSAAQLRDIADGRADLALAGAETKPVPVAPPQPPVRPPTKAVATEPADLDLAAIVERLRSFDSIEEGADYLAELRPGGRKVTKAALLKIGAEMGLTLNGRSTTEQLQQRLVNHAIGARKKYAGLQKW